MPEYITNSIKISSDVSDREDSDYTNEENPNKESNFNK